MAMEIDPTDAAAMAKLASTETGRPAWLPRLLMYIAKKSNDMARRSDGRIRRHLADLFLMKQPASAVPRRGVYTKDAVVHPDTKVSVRVFFPEEQTTSAKKLPVIFYFHGGGFAALTADALIYDIFCRRLCRRTGAVVVSVNYRRSPEHRFPAAYDDCEAAVQWVIKETDSGISSIFQPCEIDLKRIALMGDSAGANIVHEVGSRFARNSNDGGGGDVKVAAHVLLFPYFGGEERTPSEVRLRNGPLLSMENTDWHWRAFLPAGDQLGRDHPACNVFGPHAPADLISGKLRLPPSMVTVAEFDLLKDWQLRYVQGLSRLPVPLPVRLLYYPRGVHAFHVVVQDPLSSRMLTDVVAFLKTTILIN